MSETNTLESMIATAIDSIRNGKSTPKDTKIGKLFARLKVSDGDAYQRLTQEYKPVAYAYFDKHPVGVKADRILEREFSFVGDAVDEIGLEDDDFDEEKKLVAPKMEAIVSKVKAKAKKPDSVVIRDRKSFVFNGETYGKGPLVLAIIRAHAGTKGVGYAEMKKAFPDELLRGYGIFRTLSEAQEISKVRKRFFLNPDQQVKLSCGTIVAVCNQFTSENIVPFLTRATELNYKID